MGGRKWTDEELVLLEELTEKYPLETVARRLNRTKEAVFLKRQRIGIGGYMANTDKYLLWFYKKGNIILPDKDKRGAFSTVLRENSKRHHSQKPECAYQMLETFFPQAKKLELFARAERDGWDQWGNEL